MLSHKEIIFYEYEFLSNQNLEQNGSNNGHKDDLCLEEVEINFYCRLNASCLKHLFHLLARLFDLTLLMHLL